MVELVQTIFWAIVAIGLLVTIHEFGHFWVARKLGVRVLRFSVGFGRALWQRTGRDGVEYVVAAIPLGGYVKMVDEREGDVAKEDLPFAFNRQTLPVRTAIVAAGPIANFLFAFIVYWTVFTVGETGLKPILDIPTEASVAWQAGFHAGDEIIAINGESANSWERVLYLLVRQAVDDKEAVVTVMDVDGASRELLLKANDLKLLTENEGAIDRLGLTQQLPKIPAVIGSVVDQSPAELAGFMPGDRVIAADNQSLDDWQAWSQVIRAKPGQLIRVEVERNGLQLLIELTPGEKQDGDSVIGFAGVGYDVPAELFDKYRSVIRYGPVAAFGKAFEETWQMSALTLKVIGRMLTGSMSVESLGGPITIAKVAGDTAGVGMGVFFKFLAMLSVTIAVLNLLPIPVLDGGHLAFYLIEALKGSPLSDEFQTKATGIGMAIMVGVMFLAIYVDLGRYFSG